MPTHNEQVSFTAQGLVLRRMRYTDLPLAREMFEALEMIHPATSEDWEWIKRRLDFALFAEARYLMTDRILGQRNVHQVLELASGLSPRGIVMSSDPAHTYVEVDLRDEALLKEAVIKNLVDAGAINLPGPNWRILKGSVTEQSVFADAAALFRKEPIGVVCEGLLRYLSFEDKIIMATRIHNLLEIFGGVWITPDIEPLDDNRQRLRRQQSMGLCGVNVEENLFANLAETRKFFEDLGFTIQAIELKEMAEELVSPERCGFSVQQTNEALENKITFVMTVA